MPKAELHVHLEGCITAEILLPLEASRGEPANPEAFQELYRFKDFYGFLEAYGEVCRRIRRPEDFRTVAGMVLVSLARQKVRYVEMLFTPAVFFRLGLDVDEVFHSIFDAAEQARKSWDIRCSLILDNVRQWKPSFAEKTLDWALKFRPWVVGIGMGGDENGRRAKEYESIFREARAQGLRTVAHAGEIGGPRSIWDALEYLSAERIGHGVTALEDPVLVKHLLRHRITLDVSPTSNVRTGVVPSLARHPLPRLLEAGLAVTINSDDPAFFQTSLSEEYWNLSEQFHFPAERIVQLARQAFDSSFLADEEKAVLLKEFDQYVQMKNPGSKDS
ncbi:MAG: adenosine deaminase [Acidobacteria bacterium]|nr:adenosine deaminase [Acidobacteriota bacterium]